MKKIIITVAFTAFVYVASQAQNPVKSNSTAAPQFEKTMPDAQPAIQSNTATEKKKDDCSGKDTKKCGTKSGKACCKDKSDAKKEVPN